MKQLFFALASLCIISAPATAKSIVANRGECMQENVSLNINFNIPAESFKQAKAKFDEKMKQVEDFSKQQKLTKFELQSMNYNINPQNYNGMQNNFQLNGNMSYQLDSFDSAVKMGEFLTEQKFQVSLNANSYKNGNCMQAID